jgi:TP901 family phage tail tape measure protein
MLGFRNIAVAVTGDVRSLGQAMRQGAAQVDAFGNTVERSNNRQQASWLKTKAATATLAVALAAVTLAFNATVGAAAGFDARMRNVNSITQTSDGALRALGSTTLALSRELPQSANTLAEGLYDIASSGFQGAKGIEVLDASARAASAGLTTTANSAQAIAGSLNAYGLSAASAKDVSDTLFQTVNLGVLSFGDLTQGIGQVIGTAAAAGVSLDQMGQAIATMTLAGSQPAEAFTQLNQLLSQIITPSKALAGVFADLGYESGAAALKSKGLTGVMADIQRVTGGDVTQVSKLFVDIRSLRGALGLMTDQGHLYGRTVREWDAAHKGAGATARALAEQMKAVSAQWQLFTNRAAAAGITTGTLLLPAVLDLLTGVQGLAHDAMPGLNAGLHAVQPLAAAVAGIFGDIFQILGEILQVSAPVAGALLAIVATPLLAGLTVLADALQAVTGFLADNSDAVAALAGFVGGAYVASLLAATVSTIAFNIAVLRAAASGVTLEISLATIPLVAGLAASSLYATAAALVSLQGVAMLGIGAVFTVLALAINSWQKAGRAAEEYGKKQEAAFKPLDPKKSKAQIAALRETADKAATYGQQFQGVAGTWRAGWSSIFGETDDIALKGQKAAQLLGEFSAQADNADTNLQALAYDTGLSVSALTKLAIANKIDLTKPYADSGNARQRVLDLTKDIEKQTHMTGKQIVASFGDDTDAAKAYGKALTEAVDAAVSAFASATDVVGNFEVDTGKKAGSAASQFRAFVTSTKQDARAFADNIEEATRKGLDPALIAQLLEEGPAKAAPVLEQLVGGNSRTMIRMVNGAQRQLQRISFRVAEFARLTFAATSSGTDAMTHDLADAMRIVSENATEGASATAAKIGRHLHIPASEVRKIAEEFGIDLEGELAKTRPTVGITPVLPPNWLDGLGLDGLGVRVPAVPRRTVPHGAHGLAAGGRLSGPGTGTSDSLLIAASAGEWVVRARAASYYGDSVMSALNRGAIPRSLFGNLPRFADGGGVTRSSRPVVVRVPLVESSSTTNTHTAPINIEHMHGGLEEVMKMERLERLRDLQRRGRSMP